MPTITDMEGLPVTGAKDKHLGRVSHVLFHPTEPRAVGVEVVPPAIGIVIERPPRYFALDTLVVGGQGIEVTAERPETDKAAGKRLGFTWDDSVIWRFMPVVTASGEPLGVVHNVRFDATTGAVARMSVTRGATSDVAVGRQRLEAGAIIGFDRECECVRVLDEAADTDTSGGLATPAGRAAAVAKIAAGEATKQAVGGAVNIAKAVKDADVPGRARRGWESFRDAFDEGLKGEGE